LSDKANPKSKWTSRKKVLLAVAVIVALVVIPQFVYIFMQTHAATRAFSAFAQALVEKDYQRAYTMTSPEFQSATSEANFVAQQRLLCSDLGGVEKVTKGSYETQKQSDGWSSDISARVICKQGEKEVDFSLKKQSNVWKVYGYKER
jgi:hypothetical protein